MKRRFLFMSGEWSVSVPLVLQDESWMHTNIAREIVKNPDGSYARLNIRENLEGLIYYASVDNEKLRRSNLERLARENVPCWPNPGKLRMLDDRFEVLKRCVDAGLVDHEVNFVTFGTLPHSRRPERPYVLKVGNTHQGEGKILITSYEDEQALPPWEGIASVEPFFVGESYRVLFIGSDEFLLRYINDESWIKNSLGADVEQLDISSMSKSFLDVIAHARKVRDLFDLEVCGIDYVVDEHEKFHFLEYNCFPGVGTSEEIASSAKRLFRQKMDIVVSEANSRT